MAAIAKWTEAFRYRVESSFPADPTSPTVLAAANEWQLAAGGANGWMDLPVLKDNEGFQPKSTVIYATPKSGVRAMNTSVPVAGAYPGEQGSLDIYVYPELIDRILRALMGTVNRTPTAGAAALASTAFASVATLDTQPNGTEQLKFTVASSTAASAAVINIIQNGSTQESITIGTSVSSVDGDYYSKGAYNGSVNAITFTVAGTVTSGMVTIAGVDYSTNVFTQGATNPTLQIEQIGRPEADLGSGYSEFFSGVVVPSATFTYDRAAVDNLLMANVPFLGLFPTNATAGTYKNDAATYYKPIAGWQAAITLDGSSYLEVVSASININPNNELYAVSSGNQFPSGKIEGEFETFGEITILPADESRWNDYKNNTVRDVHIEFLTPYYVVDTTPYQILFEFTQMTFGDYNRNAQSMALGATLPFRAIYNATDAGSCKITTRCRMPV